MWLEDERTIANKLAREEKVLDVMIATLDLC